jgi:uncharacterized membrane protein
LATEIPDPDEEPEPRTPLQHVLHWSTWITADLVVVVVVNDALKIVRVPRAAETWLCIALIALSGICWSALQLSYGRLGLELKKTYLSDRSFRSNSKLPPLVQILIVVGAVVAGVAVVYFALKV